jgi:hypothetical protein
MGTEPSPSARRQSRVQGDYYIADFMWMGPVAFRFYLPAAHAYFASEKSNGDASSVDSIIGILAHRIVGECEDILPARSEAMSLLDTLIKRYPAFDVAEEIWGDLRTKAIDLRRRFSEGEKA